MLLNTQLPGYLPGGTRVMIPDPCTGVPIPSTTLRLSWCLTLSYLLLKIQL